MSVFDDMKLGKLITFEDATQQLAEKDNGCLDGRWALRFCLESFVRLCIRLPYPLNTWEREEVPEVGESCGRCQDIGEERNLCIYEDVEEEDKPQFCKNCYMLQQPVMGAGDYVGQRWGVLFLQSNELADLTYPDVEKVQCRTLYCVDDTQSSGYRDFTIASEYECIKDELLNSDGIDADFAGLLDQQSRVDYLSIGLSDLLVWKADFESALRGSDLQEQPMNENKTSKPRERYGQAKEFFVLSMAAYKKCHEESPETLGQLLRFAESEPNAVQGYEINITGKGNGRRIYFSPSMDKKYSVTYQALCNVWNKSKNSPL